MEEVGGKGEEGGEEGGGRRDGGGGLLVRREVGGLSCRAVRSRLLLIKWTLLYRVCFCVVESHSRYRSWAIDTNTVSQLRLLEIERQDEGRRRKQATPARTEKKRGLESASHNGEKQGLESASHNDLPSTG